MSSAAEWTHINPPDTAFFSLFFSILFLLLSSLKSALEL